jgi:D-alanyl-D-alanine carboxypeptidase
MSRQASTDGARRVPRRTIWVTAVALCAASLFAACGSDTDSSSSTTTTPSAGSSDTSTVSESALLPFDVAAMDHLVDGHAAAYNQVGMVVLIRTPEGEYVKTYGSTELGGTEAPTLDTKVRIGSNTKTWTGTVILQLVDEGKIALDDPVSTYRPEVPNGENITIAQMLGMRSGLYNYTETLEVNEAIDDQPERVWEPEELVAIGLANPPYFAPGEGYHYSNTNTVLLGLIAEELDGKPLAEIYQARIFGPAGLDDTSFPANTDTALPVPFSRGYFWGSNVETMDDPAIPADQLALWKAGQLTPVDVTNDNPSWTWSAGQGISTANDLATWAESLATGELLSPETVALRADGFVETEPGGALYSYNIAQMGPMLGHTGELPGYNSFMGHDAANDVTMIVWGNAAPGANGKPPAARLAMLLTQYVYAGVQVPADPDDAQL